MIHTVKGFGIVNKAEIDVFLELSCFFDDPADVGNLIFGSSPFLKPAWTSGSSRFTYCWSLAWRILNITLLAREMSAIVTSGKESSCQCRGHEMWVQCLGWKDPLEDDITTHSCILTWRMPWTEELGRLQSIGSHRVRNDWSDLACMHTHHLVMSNSLQPHGL